MCTILFFRMNGNKSKQKRSANLRSFIFEACVMLEMPTWMPPNMYALMHFIILTDIILYNLALENDFNYMLDHADAGRAAYVASLLNC